MKKTYPLRVDETLFAKFQVVADSLYRSVAGHIAFLMEQAVAAYERDHGAIEIDLADLDE